MDLKTPALVLHMLQDGAGHKRFLQEKVIFEVHQKLVYQALFDGSIANNACRQLQDRNNFKKQETYKRKTGEQVYTLWKSLH
ncbi:MAG: hypothetical protein QM594_08270 [Niabella sp.]